MKIINRIVEAEMTADEQVELMRLEDEVAQARDDVYFAEMDRQPYMHDSVGVCKNILDRTINNLNNYIDSITKKVMERIQTINV